MPVLNVVHFDDSVGPGVAPRGASKWVVLHLAILNPIRDHNILVLRSGRREKREGDFLHVGAQNSAEEEGRIGDLDVDDFDEELEVQFLLRVQVERGDLVFGIA